jgi:hypothetical protein
LWFILTKNEKNREKGVKMEKKPRETQKRLRQMLQEIKTKLETATRDEEADLLDEQARCSKKLARSLRAQAARAAKKAEPLSVEASVREDEKKLAEPTITTFVQAPPPPPFNTELNQVLLSMGEVE